MEAQEERFLEGIPYPLKIFQPSDGISDTLVM